MAIKLSIGSAVYNIEPPFLRAHIEGIKRQLTDETELILIDDCSTNESAQICKEYANSDSRIRYVKMEQNGGLSRVRNRTIQEAAGKWVFFADADDLLSDYFVKTALRFCESDKDIIIHNRLKFTTQKQEETPCEIKELIDLPENAGRDLSISCLCLDPTLARQFGLSKYAFYHAAWGMLYRKEFLTKNNLLFPAGQKKAQDSVFNTTVYFCAKKIAYLPYYMYYYRTNPGGITQRYSADYPQMAKSLLGHLDKQLETLFSNDKKVKERYLNNRLMALVMDNMRLNIFHKDNKKPKSERKQDFLKFIETEPYKNAIINFNPVKSGRYEWHLPAVLIRKKRFSLLNIFMGNNKLLGICCGIDKRLLKLFKK